MRPGRMKHKARARRRRVAVTCAGVSALTVMGGASAFATNGGGWEKHDNTDASLENGGDAKLHVEQLQDVYTEQLAEANTGFNEDLAITGNLNLGRQHCESNLTDGNIEKVDDNNTAGNNGGNCTNDATADNHGTASASIHTGNASAPNSSSTSVLQKNDGDSTVNNTASNNTVAADDGEASLENGGDAHLWVGQQSSVGTFQGASANTGYNSALAGVIGVNAGSQSASSGNSGGNINWAGDGNHAGNTGGNAGNTAAASNTGSATAAITTGNATASNSSTTSVTQSNTGNASSTNTANGNNVSTN
jgi:hypothetical protein